MTSPASQGSVVETEGKNANLRIQNRGVSHPGYLSIPPVLGRPFP